MNTIDIHNGWVKNLEWQAKSKHSSITFMTTKELNIIHTQ